MKSPTLLILLTVGLLVSLPVTTAGAAETTALKAVNDHQLVGGLAVIAGDGAAAQAHSLAATGNWLVRIITSDPAAVEPAVAGLYPLVTVRTSAASLRDHTVNLVVVGGAIDQAEAERLVAPMGVLISGSAVTKVPANERHDGWTHWLGDEFGRGINDDLDVAPSNSLRWWDQSMAGYQMRASNGTAVVTSTRYPVDPTKKKSPPVCDLMGIDVYSGVPLWREYGVFHNHNTSSRHGFAAGETTLVHFPRIDFGEHGKFAVLRDIRSGKLIRHFDQGVGFTAKRYRKDGTAEENAENETILGSMEEARTTYRRAGSTSYYATNLIHGTTLIQAYGRQVVRLNLETGEKIWEQWLKSPVARIILSQDGERLFVLEAIMVREKHGRWGNLPSAALTSLAFADGQQQWRNDVIRGHSASEIVQLDGDIYVFDQTTNIRRDYSNPVTGQVDYNGDLYRFDHTTGTQLWHYENINDNKREGRTAGAHMTNAMGWNNAIYVNSGGIPIRFDPAQPLKTKVLIGLNGNGRCVRTTGTPNYLLAGFGAMMDTEGNWYQTHLNRGICAIPNFAAYGAVLSPNDTICTCYNGLRGQAALVPALELNPVSERSLSAPAPAPLPSGSLPEGPITQAWNIEPMLRLYYELDTVTGAIGDGYTASIDVQRHVLSISKGSTVWHYRADARLFSLPVLHAGLIHLASADGTVTTFDAATGAVQWRFLAAPQQAEVVVNGQLESRWPVHNVVVHDGTLYAVAGRHSELDGGLWCWALEPASGSVMNQVRLFADISRVAFDGPKSTNKRSPTRWRIERDIARNQIVNGGVMVADNGQVSVINRKWGGIGGSSAKINGYWWPYRTNNPEMSKQDPRAKLSDPDHPIIEAFPLKFGEWDQTIQNPATAITRNAK